MVDYATVTDVSEFLNITIDSTSDPSQAAVEKIIESTEDYIDERTGRAWRTKTVTEEYVEPSSKNLDGTGYRFKLANRDLVSFSSGTDKIEVWNGNSWVDYVATKTEGRGNDFWVNEGEGVVFIRTLSSRFPEGVRFTYRHGKSTVDKDVRLACIMLTSADVLTTFEKSLQFPDDGTTNKPSMQNRIEEIKRKAEKILENRQEWKTI